MPALPRRLGLPLPSSILSSHPLSSHLSPSPFIDFRSKLLSCHPKPEVLLLLRLAPLEPNSKRKRNCSAVGNTHVSRTLPDHFGGEPQRSEPSGHSQGQPSAGRLGVTSTCFHPKNVHKLGPNSATLQPFEKYSAPCLQK